MGDTSRKFDWSILRQDDYPRAKAYLGGEYRDPDLIIAPDGRPYLYRWHVVPRNDYGNVYFHVQVASDPERPLHDHPWDNTSFILSGGYTEVTAHPQKLESGKIVLSYPCYHNRKPRDIIHRAAHQAHRLILPEGVDYTMTLLVTGYKRRQWGFWADDGKRWVPADKYIKTRDGVSVQKNPGEL